MPSWPLKLPPAWTCYPGPPVVFFVFMTQGKFAPYHSDMPFWSPPTKIGPWPRQANLAGPTSHRVYDRTAKKKSNCAWRPTEICLQQLWRKTDRKMTNHGKQGEDIEAPQWRVKPWKPHFFWRIFATQSLRVYWFSMRYFSCMIDL